MKLLTPLAIVVLAALTVASCSKPVKSVQYMDYSMDTTGLGYLQIQDPRIQKGDLLSITIYSDNPRASAAYNQQMVAAADPNSPMESLPSATSGRSGYLVNTDGDILMYGLGKVHVEGMTKKQLSDSLANYFVTNKLLNNPFCDIRFLNYKITVIGEVARPNVYNIPGERVTLLEALGLAGDLTNFAKRENVTIIREVDGKRTFGRVDLNSDSVFLSPYYNLQQNDVVMVDKTNRRKREPDAQRTRETIAITTSVISTAAIILSVILNNN
jgi:polysaccharide export outer membrane protein